MKELLFSILFLFSVTVFAQSLVESDEKQILAVMSQQEKCWNSGDLNCFMQGYWQSDSLKFIGSKGLTYGWKKTLDNYKKSYPDKETMGTLQFDILSIEALATDAVLLIGKWHLTREKGDVGGHYSLIWRKIKGNWVIIADHSS